jgi:hypothetical protein
MPVLDNDKHSFTNIVLLFPSGGSWFEFEPECRSSQVTSGFYRPVHVNAERSFK